MTKHSPAQQVKRNCPEPKQSKKNMKQSTMSTNHTPAHTVTINTFIYQWHNNKTNAYSISPYFSVMLKESHDTYSEINTITFTIKLLKRQFQMIEVKIWKKLYISSSSCL